MNPERMLFLDGMVVVVKEPKDQRQRKSVARQKKAVDSGRTTSLGDNHFGFIGENRDQMPEKTPGARKYN